MSRRGRGTALLAALALTACATVQPSAPSGADDALSGRLAVRIEPTGNGAARSENASFELLGSARAGELNLSTPLGSVLAQARWSTGSVVLTTPRGERAFDDLDQLTREVLGESVPVAALFDWLRGRPWPGAGSEPRREPAAPGFVQLGWAVDLVRFDQGWVTATRQQAPSVTVRAKLDQR